MAAMTRRALPNVNSSARTARQPEVPNVMAVTPASAIGPGRTPVAGLVD